MNQNEFNESVNKEIQRMMYSDLLPTTSEKYFIVVATPIEGMSEPAWLPVCDGAGDRITFLTHEAAAREAEFQANAFAYKIVRETTTMEFI